MSSSNQSPSYLGEREEVLRWFQKSPDGQYLRDLIRRVDKPSDSVRIFDDDNCTNWEDLQKEYKGAVVIAANNQEARAAFEMTQQSHSNFAPPPGGPSKMLRIFTPPLGYVLRRQVETADPYYWNDHLNVYREAQLHPDWCPVPQSYIRGALEAALPRPTQRIVAAK